MKKVRGNLHNNEDILSLFSSSFSLPVDHKNNNNICCESHRTKRNIDK
jgi:hypothetical protein